jgi:hypothetical protein
VKNLEVDKRRKYTQKLHKGCREKEGPLLLWESLLSSLKWGTDENNSKGSMRHRERQSKHKRGLL